MMGHNYQALVVKRVGNEFKLLLLTCEDADRGKPQTETEIATLKPTAVDKINYKPGIHEDIYMRMMIDNSKIKFAYSKNGKKFIPCEGEYQMKEGKWIGAKFGFIAAETNPKVDKGWVEADWIRVTK